MFYVKICCSDRILLFAALFAAELRSLIVGAMKASLILFSLGVVNVVSTAGVSIVVLMLAIELPNVDVCCGAMVSVVA